MQKRIWAAIASLMLLSGCGGQKGGTAVPQETSNGAPPPLLEKSSVTHDLATGERVYKNTCSLCHRLGLKGAPRLGDGKDWRVRLAQGHKVLYDHAITGYRGSKGFMPSRGSNAKLSDDEVKAAVDYMVWYSIPVSHGSFGSHVLSAAPKPPTIR